MKKIQVVFHLLSFPNVIKLQDIIRRNMTMGLSFPNLKEEPLSVQSDLTVEGNFFSITSFANSLGLANILAVCKSYKEPEKGGNDNG